MSKAATLTAPSRKTKRLAEISRLAKNAKKFQRTDHGGKDQMESALATVERDVINEGSFLSKEAKILVAKMLIQYGKKQVSGCRKRTSPPLDEIIELCGG